MTYSDSDEESVNGVSGNLSAFPNAARDSKIYNKSGKNKEKFQKLTIPYSSKRMPLTPDQKAKLTKINEDGTRLYGQYGGYSKVFNKIVEVLNDLTKAKATGATNSKIGLSEMENVMARLTKQKESISGDLTGHAKEVKKLRKIGVPAWHSNGITHAPIQGLIRWFAKAKGRILGNEFIRLKFATKKNQNESDFFDIQSRRIQLLKQK